MAKKIQRKVYASRRTSSSKLNVAADKSPSLLERVHKLRKTIMNNAEIYELLTYYKLLSGDMATFLETKLNSPEVVEVKNQISKLKKVNQENKDLKNKVKLLEKDNIELNNKASLLDSNLSSISEIVENYREKIKFIDLLEKDVWKIIQEKDGSWSVKLKDERSFNGETIWEALQNVE